MTRLGIEDLPDYISYDVPTIDMHDSDSCATTVLRSIIGYFEPDAPLSAEEADAAVGRKPYEATEPCREFAYLLDRCYREKSVCAFDSAEFAETGLPYLEEYYGVNGPNPRWDPVAFGMYWTPEILEETRREHDLFAKRVGDDPNYSDELVTPTVNHIRRALAAGNLVITNKKNGPFDPIHQVIVNGYDYTSPEKPFIEFVCPQVTGTEAGFLPTDLFESNFWAPEEGMLAVWK